MKLYKSLLFFSAALTAAGAITGCSEEATLDGANAVYLELQPSDIYLRLGDTVKIAPRVTNEAGDVIPTQVSLSVDDETVAKILGDTAVVAVDGGQDRSTKLRASLVNGQYAVTTVNVQKNTPQGITAINDNLEEIDTLKSWGVLHATATFAVEPRELIKDYSVGDGISAELEGLEPYTEETDGQLITIDEEKALITVHFTTPKKAGTGKVKLTVGEKVTTLVVIMQPTFQSVTFYGPTGGPDIAAMTYLGSRPMLGLLGMYFALNCEKTIDINSTDEVRVAMNIAGGNLDDIKEAVNCYNWEMVSGGALLTVRDDYEIVEGNGFDAIIGVRSGVQTGDVVYKCYTPCEDPNYFEGQGPLSLTLTYHVIDIKKQYPIQEITVSDENLELDMNEQKLVTVGVVPAASWAFQKAVVEVADPTIVEVKPYEGMELPVRGLKPGTTTITLKGYNDTQLVTKTMTVTVKDPVGSVAIDNNIGDAYIFVGGETQWKANAYSISGALMDVPLTWSSDNAGVATVADGLVSGVSAGTANISASYGSIESAQRRIRVVGAPAAVSDASGLSGFYEMDNDIVFLDADENGQLVITGGYADGSLEGTYSLFDSYYLRDDAKAPATGSVRITKGAGEYEYTVKMNVKINLSETNVVAYKFVGTVYYLPE